MRKFKKVLSQKKTLVITGWLAFLIISIILALTGQSFDGLETYAKILSMLLGLF